MAIERDSRPRSVRIDFLIERWTPSGRLVALDGDGVIVAMGWTVRGLIGTIMDLLQAMMGDCSPRSWELGWIADGRIVVSGIYEERTLPAQVRERLN